MLLDFWRYKMLDWCRLTPVDFRRKRRRYVKSSSIEKWNRETILDDSLNKRLEMSVSILLQGAFSC